jgi:hypothetical protein
VGGRCGSGGDGEDGGGGAGSVQVVAHGRLAPAVVAPLRVEVRVRGFEGIRRRWLRGGRG